MFCQYEGDDRGKCKHEKGIFIQKPDTQNHPKQDPSARRRIVNEFDKHKDKIIEYHLNDGKFMENGRPNDHIALGDGNFPFDILQKIVNSGFNGPVVFELTFADAKKSLQRINQHYPNLF